jgi:hypothetical protein
MNSTLKPLLAALVLGVVGGYGLGYWEARPWELGQKQKPPVAEDSAKPDQPKGPQAVVAETKFAFGNMESGTNQTHDFPIENRGDAPLAVKFLTHTCKCTGVWMDGKEVEPEARATVAPGEKLVVTLNWAAMVPPGPFRHGATFELSDPRRSQLELTVEGEIVASTTMTPSQLAFGSIRTGGTGRAELIVQSYLEPEVQVLTKEIPDAELAKHLNVTVEPIEKANLPDKNALAGARVVAEYDASGGIGPFNGALLMTTNLSKARTLQVPVYGTVKGDVSFFGNGWNESRGVLALPPMVSATGGAAKLNVTIRGEHATTAELAVQSVDPPQLKVELSAPKKLGDQLVQQQLDVRIPPGTPPMVRSGEEKGGDALVIMSSRMPSTPEVRLRVSFVVKP